MPRKAAAATGRRCVYDDRSCVWAGGKTVAEHEQAVNGVLAKVMRARGREFVPYVYDAAAQECRQATEKDRREGFGIFAPPVEWPPIDPAVVALIERLRIQGPTPPREGHSHHTMDATAAGVRTWNDGCPIEAEPAEPSSTPAKPSLHAVETPSGTSEAPEATEAHKRRRRRTRPSLTILRPYDH